LFHPRNVGWPLISLQFRQLGCRRLEGTADREIESPVGSTISAAAPGRGRELIETSRSHRQCAATMQLGRTGHAAVETPRRAARSRGRRGCRSRKSLHGQTAERRRRHRRSLNGNRGAGKPVPMRRSRRQQVGDWGPTPEDVTPPLDRASFSLPPSTSPCSSGCARDGDRRTRTLRAALAARPVYPVVVFWVTA
jgi:hypothetical protein